MSNKYLEILELSPGATEKDIKKAYRRLSKQFHPDINKDKGARDKFIQVAEAYEFLKEVGPSPMQEEVSYDYNAHIDYYADRRRRAFAAAKRYAEEVAHRRNELIVSIVRFFNYVASIVLFGNLLLALDYLSPHNVHDQELIQVNQVYYYSHQHNRQGLLRYDFQFSDYTLKFDRSENIQLEGYDRIKVIATPYLNKPIGMLVLYGDVTVRYDQLNGIHKIYGALITVMFIVIFSYSFLLKGPEHRLGLAILMLFVILFQMIIFIKL